MVLVGCMADLRPRPSEQVSLVSFNEAASVAQEIGAKGYIECSAQTAWNTDTVLQALCWFALQPTRVAYSHKSEQCIVF